MTTTAAPTTPGERRRRTPWMIGVGAVTFLAGLLFGYDQGVKQLVERFRFTPDAVARSARERVAAAREDTARA